MRLTVLLTTLGVLGLVAACSEEAPTRAPKTVPGANTTPGGSSGEPAPPGATPPPPDGPPAPPAEPPFVWVAPVVATTSAACGTPMPQAIHADYTTPNGRTFHVWGPS